mgnify:CR=1 FL=1|jgi:HSP20 family protein
MFDILTRNRNRDFYDSFFDDFLPDAYEGKLMKVDIRESDTAYILDIEIPGVKKEDIRLITNDDILTINVKREELMTDNNEKYLRKERKFGSMSRSFTIKDIDKDNISAKYLDGILSVNIPKITEATLDRTRTINIE